MKDVIIYLWLKIKDIWPDDVIADIFIWNEEKAPTVDDVPGRSEKCGPERHN